MRKVLIIIAGVMGGTLVAVGAFSPLYRVFQNLHPDCAPHQGDGATFVAFLYAAGSTLVVWVVVALKLLLGLNHVHAIAP